MNRRSFLASIPLLPIAILTIDSFDAQDGETEWSSRPWIQKKYLRYDYDSRTYKYLDWPHAVNLYLPHFPESPLNY